jgi:hypothetical protein
MTKLIVAFRNFRNASKNVSQLKNNRKYLFEITGEKRKEGICAPLGAGYTRAGTDCTREP